MKEFRLGRLTTIGFCAALLTLAFATQTLAQREDSSTVKTSIGKVKTFDGSAVIPYAGASLARNKVSVFSTISTSGLIPGTVVTYWWAIFNEPQFCTTLSCAPPDLNNKDVNGSLQYGGGYIVGLNGRADFDGYLEAGDNTGFFLLPQFPNMPNPAPGVGVLR